MAVTAREGGMSGGGVEPVQTVAKKYMGFFPYSFPVVTL
jgi:hypothetical protein